MKLKNLLFVIAAAVAVLACKKEDPIPAGITVDKATLAVGSSGVTEQVTVTSSEAWTATVPTAAQSWLHIVPASGNKGVSTVTVTVDPCEGKGRTARINFMASLFNAGISVTQEGTVPAGDGTLAKPFSASEANAWVMANLADGATTPTNQKYYVKGKIHKINEYNGVSQSYANTDDHKATFFISDDGEKSDTDFEAYRVYYLGGRAWREGDDDIKVGDEVIIYGQLKRYKTTAETGGSYDFMYSLNGATQGKAQKQDITQFEEKSIKEFIDLAKTDTYYRISGIVTGFQPSGNPPYQCNLTDASGASVQVYGVDDASDAGWATVANDGTLTIAAKYKAYTKDGNTTHEAVDCIFGSFVAGQSAEPKGTGTLDDPFNAMGAEKHIKDNGDASYSDANEYYIKGKIANIKNEYDQAHGTAIFSISDDGQMKSTFLCYSVRFLENKPWVDGNTQIKLGDEVIIKSKLTNYSGTYETLSEQGDNGYKGFVYSLNGETQDEVKPMIIISSFKETADGFAAELSIPDGTTGVTANLYKESIEEANLISTEAPKDNKVSFEVEVIAATKYILLVEGTLGEEKLSAQKEITTSAANEIDFTRATFNEGASASSVVWENTYLTVTLSKGTSSTDANNYIGGSTNNDNPCTHTRVYKGQKMEFKPKAGERIPTIVLEATDASYAGYWKTDCTWTGATAATSGAKVTLTIQDPSAGCSVEIGKATRLVKLTAEIEE